MVTKLLRAGTRMSIAEFLDLPDTEEKQKMELDDGELYIMPRPRPVHQFILMRLYMFIATYIDGFANPPAQVHTDMVTILSPNSLRVLVPDLAVMLADRPYRMVRGYFEVVPDIVVEVLSTDRRRDLVRKRQLYAEAGVLEYWIVDPRDDTVTLLELRDGEYAERAVLTAADTLTTPLLTGLAIPLNDVFRHRQRPAND